MSKLLIQEPPLQLLPSLAVKIGLNEAIVLQQLHYLLRDPRFGKRIEEKQWIFNTIDQWICTYFPFWERKTLMRTFANLRKMELIETKQFDGAASRRMYYRINEERLDQIGDPVPIPDSPILGLSGQSHFVPFLSTKTSSETSEYTDARTGLEKQEQETPNSSFKTNGSEGEAVAQRGNKNHPPRHESNSIPIPTLEEAELYFQDQGRNREAGIAFYHYYNGIGWRTKAGAIWNWKSKAATWKDVKPPTGTIRPDISRRAGASCAFRDPVEEALAGLNPA